MKVEFTIDEVHTMFQAVVEQIAGLELDKKDRAAIRRWATSEMTPLKPEMQRLTEKVNREIQQSHDRSEVSPIKKPDWI